MTETPVRATTAVRWPKAPSRCTPSVAPLATAFALHVVVCTALSTSAYLAWPQSTPDERTVELVFTSRQPAASDVTPLAAPEALAALTATGQTPPDTSQPPDSAPHILSSPDGGFETPPIPMLEKPSPVAPPRPAVLPEPARKPIPRAKSAVSPPSVGPPAPQTGTPAASPQMTEEPILGDWRQSLAVWTTQRRLSCAMQQCPRFRPTWRRTK